MTWWRRQRIALCGLLVAALAAVGVHLWFDVLPALETTGPAYATADEAGLVEAGGHRLALSSVTLAEFEAPPGSTTLSVRLHAASAEEAELCGTPRLTEAEGDRTWLDARGDVDVTSDDERSCQDGSASYTLLTVFLLPDDATGPFWFDLPVGRSDVVRLRVED